MKRKSIKDKNIKMEKELDTLFRVNNEDETKVAAEEEKKPAAKKEEKENRLRNHSKIKEYYLDIDGGTQYTIYLPAELHNAIKLKAISAEMSISSFLKKIIVTEILNEDELKNSYNKAYDKRNNI